MSTDELLPEAAGTKDQLYVVRMERYGNPEKHSYILGVWNDINTADQAAEAECDYRGEKYLPVIIVCTLNKVIEDIAPIPEPPKEGK